MSTDCQSYQILEHMKLFGSITPKEAEQKYGCMRLSARIWDLRHIYKQKIRTIPTSQVVIKKRFFGLLRGKETSKVRFAKYSLEQ
jgi:hypothetical protein